MSVARNEPKLTRVRVLARAVEGLCRRRPVSAQKIPGKTICKTGLADSLRAAEQPGMGQAA